MARSITTARDAAQTSPNSRSSPAIRKCSFRIKRTVSAKRLRCEKGMFGMRNCFIGSIAVLIAMWASSPVGLAQAGAPRPLTATATAFDPHDLSGYWDPRASPGTLNTVGKNRPPMTAWGKDKFSKVRTDHDGKQLSAGVSRDRQTWNDPVLWCDPPGFPRIVSLPTPPGMRFVQTGDEVLQFFEYGRTWRDIWTDGRKLSEDAEPRWYG